MRTWGMIDAVAAGTRGAALEAKQLGDHAVVVQKVDGAGIDFRQKVQIELRAVLVGWLVVNTALAELLPRPLARVPVATNQRDPICFQQRRILFHYRLRAEWRLALTHCIEKDGVPLAMRNGQCEGVGHTA